MGGEHAGRLPPPFPRWGWLFVAGPAIWYLYFWMGARAAELGCQVDIWPLLVWVSLFVAGTMMVTVSYHGSRIATRDHPSPSVMRDGFLLGAGLAAAAVLVGLPALVAHPC